MPPKLTSEDLTETEQLLVMSAAVQRFGPTKNLGVANTWNVIKRVLRWRGQTDERHGDDPRMEEHPEIMEVYSQLIRMLSVVDETDQWQPPIRPGEAFFQGNGCFGQDGTNIQDPQFTSCRLTKFGWKIARELLQRYPHYR